MAIEDITKIATDGLRYKSKEGGSPFEPGGNLGIIGC
jgi:hypothetical protein